MREGHISRIVLKRQDLELHTEHDQLNEQHIDVETIKVFFFRGRIIVFHLCSRGHDPVGN